MFTMGELRGASSTVLCSAVACNIAVALPALTNGNAAIRLA